MKLSPPPATGIGLLDRWLGLLWRKLTGDAQIEWSQLDTSGTADIDGNLTVAGDLTVSGNTLLGTASGTKSVGIGIDAVSYASAIVSRAASDASSDEYGVYIRVSAKQSSGAKQKIGILGQAATGSGFAGTGAISGFQGVVSHEISGTLGDARGVAGFVSNVSTGTITNAYLVRAVAATNLSSGSITNEIGIYCPALTAGTNKWAFYHDGTNNSAFGGKLRVGGTTAPTVSLDVTGDIAATGNIAVNGNTTLGDASSDTVTINGKITSDVLFDKTITATGTTGAQIINKNAGSVNFAAAATSLVVTDSRVTANSIIVCTVATNDTTMKSAAAVPTSGSFTIYPNAAPTAETRVNFLVIN